jgi:DNA-binding GntR family transcriptional regulator
MKAGRGRRRVVVADRLRDQIYDLLRDEIRSGALAAGHRLVEAAVAERLDVSRTPVREALFQLARDGLLARRGRGYVLPVRTTAEIVDWLELRRMLEPVIVRRACTGASAAQIAALAAAFQQEQAAFRANDSAKLLLANWKFRDTLWSMCASAILTRPVRLFDDMFQAGRAEVLNRRKNQEILIDFHRRILSAIQRRKPDEAALVMQRFIEQAIEKRHDAEIGAAPSKKTA